MVPEHLRRAVPWRLGDVYLSLGLVVVGAVLIGVASFGADGKSALGDGIPWVNLAVGGLIVLGTGAVLWVLAGLRATGQLRRLVLAELRRDGETFAGAAPSATSVDGNGSVVYVTASGMTRYHRPTCILVAGKSVERSAAPPADRRPCDICGSGSI